MLDGSGGHSCRRRELQKRIIPAIRALRVAFLFFLTAESQASPNALKEIGFAEQQEKKRVVLVRINDDVMTDDFFYDYQDADIIDWRKREQKEKLIRNLRSWAGQPENSRKHSGTERDFVERTTPHSTDQVQMAMRRLAEAEAEAIAAKAEYDRIHMSRKQADDEFARRNGYKQQSSPSVKELHASLRRLKAEDMLKEARQALAAAQEAAGKGSGAVQRKSNWLGRLFGG